MSSMSPVVLISLPNLPYLLGTFDTTQFRTWWRSAPFPDELETIKKGFHIYGRTHLALAKRKDGRWAVYRSKNYGIDWARVFLAAIGETIYDIVLITFGRAILNTSLGFYETVNAGVTWTLVLGLPTAPNAPSFYNIGGGDVLMCTDGRYIWRSTNLARSWTLILDMHTFLHDDFNGRTGYYTGPSNACIAGANGRVIVADGPFILRSDNGGLTFGRVAYWEYTPVIAARYLRPPKEVIYDRMWPMTANPGFLISQILISSIDGPQGNDAVYLLKINDVRPVAGYTDLFAWTFKSWGDSAETKNNHWKPVFQQYLMPVEGESHITSYDVAVMGQNYNDKLIFSAQTRTDSVTGIPVPSLKYSTDGGETWIDIDLGKIKIGDPDGGGVYGGSMMDDNFATLTWVGPACNNTGHYNFTQLYRRQCQSYEMDLNVAKIVYLDQYVDYYLDAAIAKNVSQSQEIDANLEIAASNSYNIDFMAEGSRSKSYQLDRTLEGLVTKEQQVDALMSADIPVSDMLDVLIVGHPKRYYRLGLILQGKASSPYNLDVILVKNRLNEKLSTIEREIVQFLDIDVPTIPYAPLDSRKEKL